MDMNVRYRFLWLFLVVSAALLSAEEAIHIIQRGETIYSVARSYAVNFQDILNLNGIDDARKVQVGQRIRIPGSSRTVASFPRIQSFSEHRVVRGETLYGIARQYGISLENLRMANKFSEKYILKAGDILRIPRTEPVITASPAAPAAGSSGFHPEGDSGGSFTVNPAVDSKGSYVFTPVVPAAAPPKGLPPGGLTGIDTRSLISRTVDTSVRWPVLAKEIAYMTGKLSGVALLGEQYEPVKSLTSGSVLSAGTYRGFGRVVIVQVAGGYSYVYGGCESLSVKEGDRVISGTELGRLGIDAVAEKPLLFFMVYRNSLPVDPAVAPRT
jgi:murein DD-endopeptidase MepM/ murein hydrolase activator NlpD